MPDEPLSITRSIAVPAAVLQPAGIDALPRALAWTLDRTTIYLHPTGLDDGDTGRLMVIGWHTDG